MGTATIKVLGQVISRAYTVKAPARFPGDPGAGRVLYGLSTKGGNPATREAYFDNTPVEVSRTYHQASGASSSMIDVIKRDIAAGRQPLPSVKLPATWGAVANGSQDAWIKSMTTALAGCVEPVWLGLHHEPVDDEGAAGSGMTAADYVAMYRHVAAFAPANVVLVPILQAAPFDPSVGGTKDPTRWFAADVCPIFGFDSYCHWSPPDINKKRDAATTFKAMFDWADKLGKPALIAEYGVRDDPANPTWSSDWMDAAKAYAKQRGAVAMAFFDNDMNVNDGGCPWLLDWNGVLTRLIAFKRNLLAR